MYFKRNLLLLSTVFTILFQNCASGMLKQEEINGLNQKYAGVYTLETDMDIGNEEVLNKGNHVRLYFHSGPDNVKVYAYPADSEREGVIGKNIIYLFDTDFPDKKYSEELLDQKIKAILKKIE